MAVHLVFKLLPALDGLTVAAARRIQIKSIGTQCYSAKNRKQGQNISSQYTDKASKRNERKAFERIAKIHIPAVIMRQCIMR